MINEALMKEFTYAPSDSRVVFTRIGTASMEATVMNCLNKSDKALIVNGGSFGQRFVDLCEIYQIPYEEIKLGIGQQLKKI